MVSSIVMDISFESIKVFPNPKNKKENNDENLENILGKEQIEKNIRRFCLEVLVDEQEIGAGNFSHVFKDNKENGICYKRIKQGAEKKMNITANMEMKYMAEVHGIDEDIKTPYALGIAEVIMKNQETNQLALTKVIAMEHFDNATRLEDVLDPFKPEFVKNFPSTFDHNEFFLKLERFIKKMHNEKGIYHRDLYARNIMIDNETGNPIVLDFGDAARQPVDENYNPYGKRIYLNTPYPDEDLKHVQDMKQDVIKYLTKEK